LAEKHSLQMKTLTIWCKSQTLQANYIIYTHTNNYIENQLNWYNYLSWNYLNNNDHGIFCVNFTVLESHTHTHAHARTRQRR